MTTVRMRTGLTIAIALCLSGQGPVALAAPTQSALVGVDRRGGGRSESHGPTVLLPDVAIEVETGTLGAISEAKRRLVEARLHIQRGTSWLSRGRGLVSSPPRLQIVEARRLLAYVRLAAVRLRHASDLIRRLIYETGRRHKEVAADSARRVGAPLLAQADGLRARRLEEQRRMLYVVKAELARAAGELERHEGVLIAGLLDVRRAFATARKRQSTGYAGAGVEWASPSRCPTALELGNRLSDCALAVLAASAGWEGNDLAIAVAIALAESGGQVDALSFNPNGTSDEGLWQINSVHGNPVSCTLDPKCNADLAFALYESDGRSFGSWTTYEAGRHLAFLERVRAALTLGRPAVTWICPVDPPHRLSDDFGAPRYGGGYHPHAGNDIFAPVGTPVRAPFAGVAVEAPSELGGLGIRVEGAFGYVYNAHLSRYGALGPVPAGAIIGYVGNSGNAATTAPHDHFEWHPDYGEAVDPFTHLLAAC